MKAWDCINLSHCRDDVCAYLLRRSDRISNKCRGQMLWNRGRGDERLIKADHEEKWSYNQQWLTEGPSKLPLCGMWGSVFEQLTVRPHDWSPVKMSTPIHLNRYKNKLDRQMKTKIKGRILCTTVITERRVLSLTRSQVCFLEWTLQVRFGFFCKNNVAMFSVISSKLDFMLQHRVFIFKHLYEK